jgi:hypothetical protein
MAKKLCETMNKECKQIFNYIRENIKEIKESQQKHFEGSLRKEELLNRLVTDVEVIKTNASNHLQHHTELKADFKWRTALIVGIVTFIVSTGVSLVIRYL